ncbi:MAG: hypothetical protein ACRDQY_22830 [Pseudonocardiaceae bacterium]
MSGRRARRISLSPAGAGAEVDHTGQVAAVTDRLKNAGLATVEENDTSRCDAVQGTVWVRGAGQELWDVYVVVVDILGESALRHRLRARRATLPVTKPAMVRMVRRPPPARASAADHLVT